MTRVWPLYVLAALGSAVGAFDLPARGALVPTLVPREHLPNAISLNTIMFQTASVVGPSLGGLMIASSGVGWVYVANAMSFGFVIVALLLMRDVPAHPKSETGSRDDVSWRAAMEGLRFVFRSPLIRSTMLLDFFATFFSSATALLPIFAQDMLQVGAKGYGWLYAAPAVGAMATSAALVPLVDRIERRGPTLLWAVAGYGLATVVFGVSRSFWLTFACLMLTGATDTVSMVIRNIVRQLETPDRLRGRMMGVNMVFFMGGPQLGELEAGAVANWLGAPFSVISGGIGCLLATGWVAGDDAGAAGATGATRQQRPRRKRFNTEERRNGAERNERDRPAKRATARKERRKHERSTVSAHVCGALPVPCRAGFAGRLSRSVFSVRVSVAPFLCVIPLPPYPPLSQPPIDDDEVGQRDRGEGGGDAEGGREAVVLDQPADRRRSGADAGVEGGEDRAERGAAPGGADVAHHVGDEHRIGGAEADPEDDRRADQPGQAGGGRQQRQAGGDQRQAGHEDPAVADAIRQRPRERPRQQNHHRQQRQVDALGRDRRARRRTSR